MEVEHAAGAEDGGKNVTRSTALGRPKIHDPSVKNDKSHSHTLRSTTLGRPKIHDPSVKNHTLRSTTLGRPKIHDPSVDGVGMPQDEKITKVSNDGKIPEGRFDELPFDPVTRDK